jgi:hypothetical protein
VKVLPAAVQSKAAAGTATGTLRHVSGAAGKSIKSKLEAASRRAFLVQLSTRESSPSAPSLHLSSPVPKSLPDLGEDNLVSLQKRKRSPSLSVYTPSSVASKKVKASEVAPSKALVDKALFRDGYTVGGCPKANDYIPTVEVLLLRCMREYETRVSTINAFPGTILRGQWARTVWKNAGEEKGVNYEITDRIVKLVRHFLICCYIS